MAYFVSGSESEYSGNKNNMLDAEITLPPVEEMEKPLCKSWLLKQNSSAKICWQNRRKCSRRNYKLKQAFVLTLHLGFCAHALDFFVVQLFVY